MPPDRRSLIERARDGDPDALGQLLEKARPRVDGLLRRWVRDRDDREDLVQETFARASARFGPKFRGDEAQFMSWLFRIATLVYLGKRVGLGRWNVQIRDVELQEELPDPRYLRRRGEVSGVYVEQVLNLAKQSCSCRQVQVLGLYIQGWSVGEIATFYGRPASTISCDLRRAGRRVLEAIYVKHRAFFCGPRTFRQAVETLRTDEDPRQRLTEEEQTALDVARPNRETLRNALEKIARWLAEHGKLNEEDPNEEDPWKPPDT